jgi:hypothetical protein
MKQRQKCCEVNNVQMKVYHCNNPQENPLPAWMTGKAKEEPQDDFSYQEEQVRKFKECPDAFFPEFCKHGKKTQR